MMFCSSVLDDNDDVVFLLLLPLLPPSLAARRRCTATSCIPSSSTPMHTGTRWNSCCDADSCLLPFSFPQTSSTTTSLGGLTHSSLRLPQLHRAMSSCHRVFLSITKQQRSVDPARRQQQQQQQQWLLASCGSSCGSHATICWRTC